MPSNIPNPSIKVALRDTEKLVLRKGSIIRATAEVRTRHPMVKLTQGTGNRRHTKVKMSPSLFRLVLAFPVTLDGLILDLDTMLDLDMDCHQLVLDMVIVSHNMDMVLWVLQYPHIYFKDLL